MAAAAGPDQAPLRARQALAVPHASIHQEQPAPRQSIRRVVGRPAQSRQARLSLAVRSQVPELAMMPLLELVAHRDRTNLTHWVAMVEQVPMGALVLLALLLLAVQRQPIAVRAAVALAIMLQPTAAVVVARGLSAALKLAHWLRHIPTRSARLALQARSERAALRVALVVRAGLRQ